MDFFAAQDQARRNTSRLVFFFALAVISLVVMTNLLVMAIFGYIRPGAYQFNWPFFFSVGVIVVLVVAGGSLYKISALSGGGDAVAAMLGGEPIFGDEGDLDRKKVINVVEEMAIASGIPVPQVYLIQEEGINAFAAGFSSSDAVIGVTSGAIRKLNREQLQGVIAHEFSHILNGDMRLNLRLIGILHGILLLGLIGLRILSGTSRASGSRKGAAPVLFLGVGLIVIGYAGTFFGKLIKAAVSRQREFLADAAAVQFTRNPQGIGGALLRIGGSPDGSLLKNPRGAEISHFFFSQGVTVFFESLFATHPPLSERIKRIMPAWDGHFSAGAVTEASEATAGGAVSQVEEVGGMTSGLVGAEVVASVGRPTEAHLGYARQMLVEIPEALQKAARDPFAARALICYLVLDPDQTIRDGQLLHLKNNADRGVHAETLKLLREGGGLLPEQRLPLVDLALPTLRRLSEPQYRKFLNNLDTLIAADGKISLFEWCLRKIVSQHLETAFDKPSGAPRNGDLDQAAGACVVLFSVLAHAVNQQGIGAVDAFAAACAEVGLAIEIAPRERLGLTELDRALRELNRLPPLLKAKVLKGCAACVTADGLIAPVEAELLRAVSATLNCPMPPLRV